MSVGIEEYPLLFPVLHSVFYSHTEQYPVSDVQQYNYLSINRRIGTTIKQYVENLLSFTLLLIWLFLALPVFQTRYHTRTCKLKKKSIR